MLAEANRRLLLMPRADAFSLPYSSGTYFGNPTRIPGNASVALHACVERSLAAVRDWCYICCTHACVCGTYLFSALCCAGNEHTNAMQILPFCLLGLEADNEAATVFARCALFSLVPRCVHQSQLFHTPPPCSYSELYQYQHRKNMSKDYDATALRRTRAKVKQ